jgi:hypothetical protein
MPFSVWFFIALSFFWFSIVFWRYSRSPIRNFSLRQRDDFQEKDVEENESLRKLLIDIEGYLDSINRANKTRYRISSLGFLIAGITAVLSMFIR